MSDLQRETLGSIARLAEQMAYAAMQGHSAMVQAQFETMRRYVGKLQMVQNGTKWYKSISRRRSNGKPV